MQRLVKQGTAMTLAEKTLRGARVFHAAFLLTAILYILVPAVAIKTQTRDVSSQFVLPIAGIAAAGLGVGFYFRNKMVLPAAEVLRQNPEDAEAAGRWRSGVLLSIISCEAAILFGLALRFTGVTWNICGLFYIASILLMLAWTPKLDLPAAG